MTKTTTHDNKIIYCCQRCGKPASFDAENFDAPLCTKHMVDAYMDDPQFVSELEVALDSWVDGEADAS